MHALSSNPQSEILLVAINARYRHSSIGLRCLQANLGGLEPASRIVEFTLKERAVDMLEVIVQAEPRIVGIGVYVWNVQLVHELSALIRAVLPDCTLVLGGPEVSHELEGQPLEQLAHFVVQGEGELAFSALCSSLLRGERPEEAVIQGSTPPMTELALPYRLYTDEDIANRVLYVEASRGCPYRCEFCISSLDKKVRDVPTDLLFQEIDRLWERGGRDFKFIDRTFNLSLAFSMRVLEFFLEKGTGGYSLHFEMVPERLPPELLDCLARFEPGVVQLEVGVQTFDAQVARRVSRPMQIERICTNLLALHHQTRVHLHVDLIVGLPGEDLRSFQTGFDRLHALGPHEIQVGILKRLKGTPIRRHTKAFEMTYSPLPPFEIMRTSVLSYEELNEMKRFSQLWDRVVNNGQFPEASTWIWKDQDSVFEAFRQFSAWAVEKTGRSTHLSLMRLSELLCDFVMEFRGVGESEIGPVLVRDLKRTRGRRLPERLRAYDFRKENRQETRTHRLARQRRHLGGVEETAGSQGPITP